MSDVYKVFNSWDKLYYPYLLFICHPSLFIEGAMMDLIQRKFYCDKFPSVPPFPGSYDDQPEYWITASQIIEKSARDAIEWSKK